MSSTNGTSQASSSSVTATAVRRLDNIGSILANSAPAPPPSHPVYYNPRLDPKNFLEGPLSHNPATRLRQMLARPGIVVSILSLVLGGSV